MNQNNMVRKLLNRLGWDVCHYRPFLEVLSEHAFDLVIDVGANEGQFIKELERSGYKGDTISYEPCQMPYRVLVDSRRNRLKNTMVNKALGNEIGKKVIRVYSDTRFSSFNKLRAVDLVYSEEEIDITTLNSEFESKYDFFSKYKKKCLKVDTQGFERDVLEGGSEVLGGIDAVIMECSYSRIYDRQWLIEDTVSYLRKRGFVLWGVKRGFIKGSREYECDCLFLKI
ncbi:FkbM family methyltransferase [Rubritalea marina]|uniref:FkbM family methyltransferase n=1 Tax=Rubritalea marina TaxID=361055 RepID=UPI000371AE49|nr:FkbM family methyltransferase [Rubritalea marina]